VTHKLGRVPTEPEIAREMDMSLSEFQQLLGELKGLEIGSLHLERTENSGDDELAYIPGSPDEDPLFRLPAGRDEAAPDGRHRAVAGEGADGVDALLLRRADDEEIGLTLGVVESRVSQIHSSAVLRFARGAGRAALGLFGEYQGHGGQEEARCGRDGGLVQGPGPLIKFIGSQWSAWRGLAGRCLFPPFFSGREQSRCGSSNDETASQTSRR